MGEGGFARLRAGRSAALACHRHAIHYRSPSNPPSECPDQSKNTIRNRMVSCLVGEGGFEPPKAMLTDLQSAPFGHSGIPPYSVVLLRKVGAGRRTRTPDLLITNQLLYQLSYTSGSTARLIIRRKNLFVKRFLKIFFFFGKAITVLRQTPKK